MDIPLILDRIRPGAKWRMAGTYELLKATWEDGEQIIPTQQELADEWAVIEKELSDTAYQLLREAEYPPAEDLIVPLWEKIVEGRSDEETGVSDLQAKRLEVKQKYPKPEKIK